jgi:hypothetical protein
MSELTSHTPERTAVRGPESAGSLADRCPNALATAVDMSGGESPAPPSWAEKRAFCGKRMVGRKRSECNRWRKVERRIDNAIRLVDSL